MQYRYKKTDECAGCIYTRGNSCPHPRWIKVTIKPEPNIEKIYKCPCQECLVKMICVENCEDFNSYTSKHCEMRPEECESIITDRNAKVQEPL